LYLWLILTGPEEPVLLRAISESLGWPLNEMMRIVNRGRDMQNHEPQEFDAQGRDPLVASADEAAELRDHGILYAAGYSELSAEMFQSSPAPKSRCYVVWLA